MLRTSLTVKWITTLALTSLIGIVLVAVVVNAVTTREFNRLVAAQAQENFAAIATGYYENAGSWTGFTALFGPPDEVENGSAANGGGSNPPANARPPVGMGPPNTRRGQIASPAPGLVLVGADGRVIFGSGRYAVGSTIRDSDVVDQTAVTVSGQQVGTVLFVGGSPELDARQQVYVETTNTAIIIGAVGAVAASVLVGTLLSGAILRPLRALTHAVKGMHAGELEQRVEVRSRDELGELATAFNDMSARLSRANHLRKQMTADIAHELRSPLTVLSGYLEGMRDGTLKPTPARFETMYGEATQLGRLIDDLRTLSLADAGELRLMRQPIDPRDLLVGVAASFQPGADAKGITLVVDIPDASQTLPVVQIDRERMSQVLANLVGNALRYARSQITLKAVSESGGVRLSVEDDGEGISPDKLPYVFERFYRADESRSAREGQSGLGLAIARSIVEAHGGTIRAESQVGQGTAMIISLPA